MSHVASFVAVAFLTVSIIFTALTLSQAWWVGKEDPTTKTGFTGDVTLWEITMKNTGGGQATGDLKIEWDEICDSATASDDIKSGCIKVKMARAFFILAAIFAFFAAIGNAVGIYQGNTLVDAAAGVMAGFSSFFSGMGIMMMYLTLSSPGIDNSPARFMSILGCGFQFAGAICGCVGTCQEMHDIAKLAARLHLGAYKDAPLTKTRSEKAAALRRVEEGEAKEIYDNLQKRRKAAEEAAAHPEDGPAKVEEKPEDKKKKIPVMLQRVLFRKPVEGDDDEIPTKMLEDAFAEIDGDGSGSIELEELVDALKLCGLAVSKNATDTIMKEIDKNASGDVDLREFIEFFRHIEDLNRFQKKTAARQQFVSFLLNFCFLGDILVVGIMLMMYIKMDPNDNPDNYAIMKNVLIACSAFLGILFLLVILMPILRLALGPTANKMQKQYELAQEIKKQQRKKMDVEEVDEGPRQAGYTADDPPPPVNAAMFGRSYRPGKVDSEAWTPALEDTLESLNKKPEATVVQAQTDGHQRSSSHDQPGHHGHHGHGHGRRSWRYDPANYSIASEHAGMLEANGLGPTSWTPMQVRDVNVPKQTAPAVLPGAPLSLTDAAFPQPTNQGTLR